MRLNEQHYTTSAYEQRKRALTVDCLPHAHYEHAFEPGCGYGHLSELLAPRCTRLLATDIDTNTLAQARTRLAGHSNVYVKCLRVPDEWPLGEFDLIVVAEFLYYLSRDSIAAVARAAARSVRNDGTLVACHWRHPIPESDFSGDAVHEILQSELGMECQRQHVEDDFVLTQWRQIDQRVTRTTTDDSISDRRRSAAAVASSM
jgi:SAM-dependent methyltransferase